LGLYQLISQTGQLYFGISQLTAGYLICQGIVTGSLSCEYLRI